MRSVLTLKEQGVEVVVQYSNMYEEYRVKILGRPTADYFTPHKDDALRTARSMMRAELALQAGPAVGQNDPDCSPVGAAPGSPTTTRPALP